MDLAIAEYWLQGGLIAACLMLAAALVLVAVNSKRRLRQTNQFGKIARARGRRLTEMLRLFSMAEEIANLGIWQYFPRETRQEWSAGMKGLFGVEADEELMAGDAETLLAACDIDLIDKVMNQEDRDEAFAVRFKIFRLDGSERTVKMQACHLQENERQPERVIGVLIDVTDVANREKQLEESREKALMEAQEARELAETDPLTGLANRRRVMSQLDRLVMTAHSNNEPLAMIVFDIDHFKTVNDTYGHPEGDKVLRRIATVATEQARASDVIGRIGGEEFAWIVPGADESFAKLVAERLRLAIAVDGVSGEVPMVTVSMGIAAIETGDTSLSLFARADAALYSAKNAGRNTVKLAA